VRRKVATVCVFCNFISLQPLFRLKILPIGIVVLFSRTIWLGTSALRTDVDLRQQVAELRKDQRNVMRQCMCCDVCVYRWEPLVAEALRELGDVYFQLLFPRFHAVPVVMSTH
jgi:hypothetical protein